MINNLRSNEFLFSYFLSLILRTRLVPCYFSKLLRTRLELSLSKYKNFNKLANRNLVKLFLQVKFHVINNKHNCLDNCLRVRLREKSFLSLKVLMIASNHCWCTITGPSIYKRLESGTNHPTGGCVS